MVTSGGKTDSYGGQFHTRWAMFLLKTSLTPAVLTWFTALWRAEAVKLSYFFHFDTIDLEVWHLWTKK